MKTATSFGAQFAWSKSNPLGRAPEPSRRASAGRQPHGEPRKRNLKRQVLAF